MAADGIDLGIYPYRRQIAADVPNQPEHLPSRKFASIRSDFDAADKRRKIAIHAGEDGRQEG